MLWTLQIPALPFHPGHKSSINAGGQKHQLAEPINGLLYGGFLHSATRETKKTQCPPVRTDMVVIEL